MKLFVTLFRVFHLTHLVCGTYVVRLMKLFVTLFRVFHLTHYICPTYYSHCLSAYVSLTRLSCAQRTEKRTFFIVLSACSRRDRQMQMGNFQGPVCVSRLPSSRLPVPSVRHRRDRQTGHFHCPVMF